MRPRSGASGMRRVLQAPTGLLVLVRRRLRRRHSGPISRPRPRPQPPIRGRRRHLLAEPGHGALWPLARRRRRRRRVCSAAGVSVSTPPQHREGLLRGQSGLLVFLFWITFWRSTGRTEQHYISSTLVPLTRSLFLSRLPVPTCSVLLSHYIFSLPFLRKFITVGARAPHFFTVRLPLGIHALVAVANNGISLQIWFPPSSSATLVGRRGIVIMMAATPIVSSDPVNESEQGEQQLLHRNCL